MAEGVASGPAADSTDIANELIGFANDKLETGTDPTVIAAALRHAAGNFTAFAYCENAEPLDLDGLMEEFARFLTYYDEHHRGSGR